MIMDYSGGRRLHYRSEDGLALLLGTPQA